MSSLPILGLMNQRVGIRRKVHTYDNSYYHEVELGKSITYPARVEFRHSITYGINDTSLPSCATIYTLADVMDDDEVVMPDGSIRSVLSVEHCVDGNGVFSHSIVSV